MVGKRYETHVTIYADRAEIKRKGMTGNLPMESTAFFSDTNGVASGKASGRTWISFIVPGAYQAPVTRIQATKQPNVSSGGDIPYSDPFSIVSGVGDGGRFAKYAEQIQEIFSKYKSSHKEGASVIQAAEDNTLDKLKKLKELHDLGVLTDEEFEAKNRSFLMRCRRW